MTDFVAPSSWELAGLLCQFSLYLAAAALAGTALNIAFYNDGSRATLNGLLGYGLLAAVLGFHAALLNYLVQVGMLSGSGVAGMFDLDMASLLIDTPCRASALSGACWRVCWALGPQDSSTLAHEARPTTVSDRNRTSNIVGGD